VLSASPRRDAHRGLRASTAKLANEPSNISVIREDAKNFGSPVA
jgi:hypothetical protein